jgi:hypothetical protein
MGDQACTHNLANECRKIRSDNTHLGDEIAVESLSVVGETDHSLSKESHIFQV